MKIVFNIEPQRVKSTLGKEHIRRTKKGMLEQFKTCPSIIISKTRQTS